MPWVSCQLEARSHYLQAGEAALATDVTIEVGGVYIVVRSPSESAGTEYIRV
jgi:hypothetical protein